MDIPSYVLLSHEQALQRRLDVAANNMANSSTVGFRAERPVFHEYVERMSEKPGNDLPRDTRTTAFVQDYRATHDTRQGDFQATGNPTDVMVDGPGWLSVATPEGGTAYTRAGFLHVGPGGDIVTASGAPVLDEGGRPIAVPPEEVATLAVGNDGTVSTRTGALGRIAVTVFDDEGALYPRGDGLMDGTGGRVLAADETKLRSGGVEQSNVNPIAETTELIDILRSYQSSLRMTESLDTMRKDAIGRLGRID